MLRTRAAGFLVFWVMLLVPSSARELACLLQGGLIDLRYGQASIDVGGTGVLLQWDEQTVFTLDGSIRAAEELASALEDGTPLKAVASYQEQSGRISRLDAFSPASVPAVSLQLKPWVPVLKPGQKLEVVIERPEAERSGLTTPTLRIPGQLQSSPFRIRPDGSLKASLVVGEWGLRDVPLLVQEGQRTLRGKRISVSAGKPRIGESGPTIASDHLDLIPGWFTLEGSSLFLDPGSVRLQVSNGAEVVQVFPRRDRVDFTLRVAGPGNYQIQASISDQLGRSAEKSWSFTVRP